PLHESIYLMYFDANNLYGWAMSQYLPVNGFQFCPQNELKYIMKHLDKIEDESDVGYILEVDLEYPEHLHDLHNMYPLAPEQIIVPDEDLSQTQISMLQSLKSKRVASTKLIPSLKNRLNYVVHYRNL